MTFTDFVYRLIALITALLILTGLWFTMDDYIAEVTNTPWLGSIPFWRVLITLWMFIILINLPRSKKP